MQPPPPSSGDSSFNPSSPTSTMTTLMMPPFVTPGFVPCGGGANSAEMEIEKILNDIGFFPDDYVMVHDKTGDLTALSVVSASSASPSINGEEEDVGQQQNLYCVSPPMAPILPSKVLNNVVALEPAVPLSTPSSAVTVATATVGGSRKRKSPNAVSSSSKKAGKHQITELERR